MNRVQEAFDSIRAEDSLKETTLKRLREKTQEQKRPRRYINVRRIVALAACLLLLVLASAGSYALYFTETAYVDIDINPSVALSLNRFGRVIGANAYNADGAALLETLDLKNKKLEVAMDAVIEAAAKTGALERERLISVTVQTAVGEQALVRSVRQQVEAAARYHGGAVVDVFSVSVETRGAAHGMHMSPAKYLAILELQAVDPSVSFGDCAGHTIGEIREQTRDHGASHEQQEAQEQQTQQQSSGHSNGNSSGDEPTQSHNPPDHHNSHDGQNHG